MEVNHMFHWNYYQYALYCCTPLPLRRTLLEFHGSPHLHAIFFCERNIPQFRDAILTYSKNFHESNFHRMYEVRPFCKKIENVRCEDDRSNGWNSIFEAAWYIRHVRWTRLFYTRYFICNMVFANESDNMVVNTQFQKPDGRSFARVL